MARPRDLAQRLRSLARREPDEAERYLIDHAEEWNSLAESSPEDAADILEEIGGETAIGLLTDLNSTNQAELLEELRDDLAAGLLAELSETAAARLLESMPADEAADILAVIDEDIAARLLDTMDEESADHVEGLLAYEPDSAGGLMTTNIASLPAGLSVGEAVERIRGLREELEHLSYVYVVDDSGRLVGVVSFRDLVFHRPGDGLDEAMIENPIRVTTDTDREEVSELATRYHLLALPVVDKDDSLVGMVPTEEILLAVKEEASEDFAVAVGTAAEDSIYVPVRTSIRHRLPWIAFDLVLSFIVVVAISRFDEVITAFVVLAALMPLVARIGGDAGAQTLAVVIRGLATDGIPSKWTRRVLGREATIGVINGLIVGSLAGLIGFTLQSAQTGGGAFRVGLAMLLAAWANLTLAGLLGAAIPLALRRLKLDPALGSNLFLTTFTDLLGFVGFLSVASALL